MTQNVDLQVKVKFVVDPKDLQAALSGSGASTTPGSRSVGKSAGVPRLDPSSGQVEKGAGRVATERLKILEEGNKAEKRREIERERSHRAWLKTEEDARKLNLQAYQFEQRRLRAANRPGRGYGSEGMFAAGTSPIMQGLAWQSLFATGDILGPMSFAPMALYQNFSLRRQRRNRGFNLGAGSDLAKAAGVGDTGQIATAGHALAALRANTALTPEERERRMAQVDIMSAGRVRGRLGRNIEMFEAGQLGGSGMQVVGRVVGALGGVSSVALGLAAGLGAVAMTMKIFDDRMKESVESIRAGTSANDAQRRASRINLQLQMEKSLAGDVGADLSALERAGISRELSPGMRGQAAAAVRSFGGDRAKLLLQLSEKAATLYDTTPEEAMQALISGGAGRGSAEAASKRVPQIMATAFHATGDVRRTMRARWDTGVAPTEVGKLAEKYRGDVAYAEGKNFTKFFENQERVKNRMAELDAKIAEEKEYQKQFGSRFSVDQFRRTAEKTTLAPEQRMTRALANDPTAIETAQATRKQIEVLDKLGEQIEKQSVAITGLSLTLEGLTFGAWESLRGTRYRLAKEFEEENRRKMLSAGAP